MCHLKFKSQIYSSLKANEASDRARRRTSSNQNKMALAIIFPISLFQPAVFCSL